MKSIKKGSNRDPKSNRIQSGSSKESIEGKKKKQKDKERERRYSHNSFHSNPDNIMQFLNAPLFDVYTKAKDIPENPLLAERICYPEREDKYRKDNMEKERKLQEEREYERVKEEEKKENELKKKEIGQNLKRRNFTFGYEGKIVYIKPQKETDVLVNEIVEIGHDTTKKPKANNPEQKELQLVEVEILEKEVDEEKGYFKEKQSKPVKKPKIVGQFKPQAPLKELFQVAPGVSINYGRGKPNFGGTFKIPGRIKKKDFKKQFKQIDDKDAEEEGSQTLQAKKNQQQVEREERYRRTVDNWKEELKRGLVGRGIDFDPDMLIRLIMTEENPLNSQNRIQKRVERLEKKNQEEKIKEKLRYIMDHKEKYLNRITSFNAQLGSAKNDQEQQIIISNFQKEIKEFNKQIVEKGAHEEGQDQVYDAPETSEERRKKQYRLPRAKSDMKFKKLEVGSQLKSENAVDDNFEKKQMLARSQSQFLLNKNNVASKARLRQNQQINRPFSSYESGAIASNIGLKKSLNQIPNLQNPQKIIAKFSAIEPGLRGSANQVKNDFKISRQSSIKKMQGFNSGQKAFFNEKPKNENLAKKIESNQEKKSSRLQAPATKVADMPQNLNQSKKAQKSAEKDQVN